jgi:hypothetical protein
MSDFNESVVYTTNANFHFNLQKIKQNSSYLCINSNELSITFDYGLID